VAELVLGWDGINPEKPGVAESKLVCIGPELEGPGTTGPVDFDFCLLEVLGAFAAEAPLAGGFLFLLGGLILSDVSDFFRFEDD
jgi:hypothetical protein